MESLHLAKIIILDENKYIIDGAFLADDSKLIKTGKREDFGNLIKNVKTIDHGSSLICPGFINLHTHLLYSNINQINEDNGLFPWLEKLIAIVASWEEKDYIKSIQKGINLALSTGTTFIVENTPSNLSAEILSTSPLKALIGIEVFGLDETTSEKTFQTYLENLLNLQNIYKNIDFCFSPHAPYDVSIPLWEKLIGWSEKNNKPLLTHLEESPQEKSWWNEKVGPALNFWRKINKLESKLKYWTKYNSGMDFLNKNKLLSKELIATHLCQANKKDLKLLKAKNISLVHCPRSNFYLNNGTANLKLWDEMDLLWGVGTDSTACNQNLDLLEEVKFTINQQRALHNYNISAKNAFKAITKNPATILKMDQIIGSLRAGCHADFLVYDIKEKSDSTYQDPYHLLIWDIHNSKNLKEVWINSQVVWQSKHLVHRI